MMLSLEKIFFKLCEYQMTAFQTQLKSDLSKGLCASVGLLFSGIASQSQPQFPQALFHPNLIYQNLNRYSPTIFKQQRYYAQILGETSSSQSLKPEI